MFSGVGGFREGLTRAGGFTCVGHSENDKYANRSYNALFNTEGEWFCEDARTIEPDKMPEFDLLCGGFPCQSFSTAGLRKGFSESRGTLFFELARILEARHPSYFLFENVPGLLSHDKGQTFCTILRALSDLGYCVEWTVLDSKNFAVPQSRKRVYIAGFFDNRCAGKILPFREANRSTLVQLLPGRQGNRVYDPKGLSCTLTALAGGGGGKTGLYAVGIPVKEATKQGFATAFPGDSIDLGFIGSNTRRGRVGKQIAHTMTTKNIQGVVTELGRIRRLTPREALRLQGFYEEQIDKILAVNSDVQAYKQAGNGVTVTVVEAIGRQLSATHAELRKE